MATATGEAEEEEDEEEDWEAGTAKVAETEMVAEKARETLLCYSLSEASKGGVEANEF